MYLHVYMFIVIKSNIAKETVTVFYQTISTLNFKSNLAVFNLCYLFIHITQFLNLYAPVGLFKPRVYQSVNVQLLDQVFN